VVIATDSHGRIFGFLNRNNSSYSIVPVQNNIITTIVPVQKAGTIVVIVLII
jgi:hypothetical protein